jgi:tetratricopeptide (TPR) repeat protein/tRNA A-37 threonylcarbamoyl transferase component Bud32
MSIACLDDETIAAIADGALEVHGRVDVEEHLVGCDACQTLVAAIVRAQRGVAEELRPGDVIGPGARFDRFVVVRRLGSGASSDVYEAYDPVLDRDVALKVLAPLAAYRSEAGQLRAALREARAMARLSHPNIVPVHDVGVVDGCTYLVMERVGGQTLRAWLGGGGRRWEEVVDAFCQAGRGLEAAHAAGIAHGDFKPDNALVTPDGRVLVTDFGLSGTASVGLDAAGDPKRAGSLGGGGTPAYMAPEIREGGRVDATADQYAFCASLFEALTGALPGVDLPAIAAPRRGALPARLRATIGRGLAPQPERRYPSMTALLDALRRLRARSASRAWLAAGASVLAIAASAHAAYLSPAALERRAASLLAGTWDGARRGEVQRALATATRPPATSPWSVVSRELDRFSAAWTAAYASTSSLEALSSARARGEARATRACLEERLVELGAVVDLLAKADALVVGRAPNVVFGLTPVQVCSGQGRGEATLDAATAQQSATVRRKLAAGKALLAATRYEDARAAASAALDEARAMGHERLGSEAQLEKGQALARLGQPQEAESMLREAAWSAEAARHDDVVVRAWTELVYLVGYRQRRLDQGRLYARHATAALARLGAPPLLDANLQVAVASMSTEAGDRIGAFEAERRAALLYERVLGPNAPHLAQLLSNHAMTEQLLGRFEEARADGRRAVELLVTAYGPESPAPALTLSLVGLVESRLGLFDDAIRDSERALKLREQLGRDDFMLATMLGGHGLILEAAGRTREAVESLQRAVGMAERVDGEEGALTAENRALLATTLASSRADEAEVLARKAQRAFEKIDSAQGLIDAEIALGLALTAKGNAAAASAELERAGTLAARFWGEAHVETAVVRARSAVALSAAGRLDDAQREAGAALSVLRGARVDVRVRAAAAHAAQLPPDPDEALVGAMTAIPREEARP